MATTADYLNKLVAQKNALADNLVTKGVTATHDETLESLVPKVLEISGYVSESGKMGYVTNGLVCHYSADSTHFSGGYRIDDLSGNGNTGLFFNSSNNNIFINNSGNNVSLYNKYINIGEQNYENITVECVFKVNTTTSSQVCIASNYENGGYGLKMVDSIVQTQMYINNSYKNVYDNDLVDSNIVYYATTYDGNVLKLFKNGILINSDFQSGEIGFPINNSIFMINANPTNGSGAESSGSLYDMNYYAFRLYDRALSNDEILHNFNRDNAIFTIISGV